MRSLALSSFKALYAIAILIFLVLPTSAFADTLFVSPVSGAFKTGETFMVQVLVSTPNQSINAVSGILTYPPDKLQVTSISKAGSILSLWVQEPTFTNVGGIVDFEGVVPNPGFGGLNGRVITVNFRAVATGIANVRLTSGSILANDGYGTDLLRVLGSAVYNIGTQAVPPFVIPPLVVPPLITATSATGQGTSVVPRVVEPTSRRIISFAIPTMEETLELLLKSLYFAIPLALIILIVIYATRRSIGNAGILGSVMKKDLSDVDRAVKKTFETLKEDAGDANTTRLKENLAKAEESIRKEVENAEKHISG